MESRKGIFIYNHCKENPKEILEELTINAVWENCINKIGSFRKNEQSSLAAERLIVGLIHRGISKEKIRIRHTHFTVSIHNKDYLILKRTEGVVIMPINCALFKSITISANANLLADFMLAFDAAIPEMRRVAQRLYTHYRKEELKYEIKLIVSEALNKGIDSITLEDADVQEQ